MTPSSSLAFGPRAELGVCLVDFARHVARAYAQTRGVDPERVLQRIREGFDAEWTCHTDDPRGSIVS